MKNLKTHGEVAISNETRQLKEEDSQVLWFTPAIPATWEAEIRRIIIQGKPRQKVSEILSHQISWTWWCISCLWYSYVRGCRQVSNRPVLGKNMRTFLKNNIKLKRAEVMAQVVECLLSKCKALNSNPTITKKK
jgi:hypothetical protein